MLMESHTDDNVEHVTAEELPVNYQDVTPDEGDFLSLGGLIVANDALELVVRVAFMQRGNHQADRVSKSLVDVDVMGVVIKSLDCCWGRHGIISNCLCRGRLSTLVEKGKMKVRLTPGNDVLGGVLHGGRHFVRVLLL